MIEWGLVAIIILQVIAFLQLRRILMATIADVEAAVAAQNTVIGSVVTLLTSISQQLKDAIAANDPAALQGVVDNLDANTKVLADAVVANTPAAPPIP